MKQVLIKKGHALVEEVPAPTVSDDSVLVQVFYSCISIGTELSAISFSGESLLKKALNHPEKVMKVFENIKKNGLGRTIQKVQNKFEEGASAGNSATGIVLEIGELKIDYIETDSKFGILRYELWRSCKRCRKIPIFL